MSAFTIIVNPRVKLTDEHKERIIKSVLEHTQGLCPEEVKHDVGFVEWHEVVGQVVEAQEKHQIRTIEALAADMAHRS